MRIVFILLMSIYSVSASAFGNVKIEGAIQHKTSDTIRYSYNANRIAFFPKIVSAPLDKDGKFSMTVPVADLFTQGELIYNGKKLDLILQEGKDIQFTAVADSIEKSFTATGSGSSIANFVVKHFYEKGNLNYFGAKLQQHILEPTDSFQMSMTYERNDEWEYLEKNKADLPQEFITYWKSFYEYFTLFNHIQYPYLHEVYKQKTYYIQGIPEENYALIKDIPYKFNDSLLDIIPYRLYVDNIFRIKLEAKGYVNIDSLPAKKYQQEDSITRLVNKLLPDATTEYFFASNIYGKARRYDIKRLEQQINTFKARWPKSIYTPMLTKELAQVKKVSVGEPMLDFSFYTLEGKKSRLSEYIGKVIMLSFWISDNEGCARQMNILQKVAKKYADKDIVFVNVSLDNNEAILRKNLEKYKFSFGINTFSQGVWSSRIAIDYGIVNAPTYFLINKEGKFALQNTPSPLFPDALAAEIDKLLK
jgi:peroxiredoxin